MFIDIDIYIYIEKSTLMSNFANVIKKISVIYSFFASKSGD